MTATRVLKPKQARANADYFGDISLVITAIARCAINATKESGRFADFTENLLGYLDSEDSSFTRSTSVLSCFHHHDYQ